MSDARSSRVRYQVFANEFDEVARFHDTSYDPPFKQAHSHTLP